MGLQTVMRGERFWFCERTVLGEQRREDAAGRGDIVGLGHGREELLRPEPLRSLLVTHTTTGKQRSEAELGVGRALSPSELKIPPKWTLKSQEFCWNERPHARSKSHWGIMMREVQEWVLLGAMTKNEDQGNGCTAWPTPNARP